MIKPHNTNSEFDLGGINHVALVCSDMARTVDFYSNVLGMPLVKSLDLPGGAGQHFFFDAGNGDCVAFFWFTDAPDRVPGLSSPATSTARTNPSTWPSSWRTARRFGSTPATATAASRTPPRSRPAPRRRA